MGSIKERNGMDLTKAEDIKRGARIHSRIYAKKKKIFTSQIITRVGLLTLRQTTWNATSSGPLEASL